MAALCVACPGSSDDTTASGGSESTSGNTADLSSTSEPTSSTGGPPTSTSTSTDATSTTNDPDTSSSADASSSSTTGGACVGANELLDNYVGPLVGCDQGIQPLANEDGTFAVTVFGPFAEGLTVAGFEFVVYESALLEFAVTDPWTAAVIVVPEGDAIDVDPNTAAQPYALTLVETYGDPDAMDMLTINRYSVTLDAPLAVDPCARVLVALRNTYGPPTTAIGLCETSTHPETNLWWNLDGTYSEMISFAPTFDGDWGVSLVPG